MNSSNNYMTYKTYEADVFSRIKDCLDISHVLEYYGVPINNRGFALCPFHQENTPSFKVYDNSNNSNSFHCFGCGESGTAVDFVVKYFRLSNIDAVKKLNADFGLHLFSTNNKNNNTANNTWGAANRRSPQESKHIVDNFAQWEKQAFITVSSYFRALKFYGEQIFIHHIDYFYKYLSDVENIVFIEDMLDLMIANTRDFKAQAAFYKAYREAVTAIEQKLHTYNS